MTVILPVPLTLPLVLFSEHTYTPVSLNSTAGIVREVGARSALREIGAPSSRLQLPPSPSRPLQYRTTRDPRVAVSWVGLARNLQS